jgi:hypothetical protein
MSDRRYREDEVRKIFKLATSDRLPSAPGTPANDGLTLAEIQSIGGEIGVDAERIAHAAAALDTGASEHVRDSFGAPVEVGMAVPLPRAMSEQEWEQVVALMRSTFKARGQITTTGNLREWRNGNLHASHEPFGSGYRLRLGTTRGDANGVTALGFMGLAASAATYVAHLAIADPASLAAPLVFGAFGVSAFITNWVRLPRWAKTRAEQMKQIAARVKAMMGPENG